MSNISTVSSKVVARRKKNRYTPQFKLDRALEAIRTNNISEVARKYNLNSNLIYLWRDQLIERGVSVFETTPDQTIEELKTKIIRLEQIIGKKEVELGLLKNFSDFYAYKNTS